MDKFSALDRAAEEFESRLRLVGPEHWQLPTPCSEWDVRGLVNHVIGGAHRYTLLIGGATAEEAIATHSMDHIGDDAVASFKKKSAEVAAAFIEPGALQRTCHHPAGDRSGEDLLWMRILEFAVHGWDLARAIGADERLDPALVDALVDRPDRGPGLQDYFDAPAQEVPPDASPQTRLLLLVGRHP